MLSPTERLASQAGCRTSSQVKSVLAGVVDGVGVAAFYYAGFIGRCARNRQQSLGSQGRHADVSAKGFSGLGVARSEVGMRFGISGLGSRSVGQTHTARSELDRVAI